MLYPELRTQVIRYKKELIRLIQEPWDQTRADEIISGMFQRINAEYPEHYEKLGGRHWDGLRLSITAAHIRRNMPELRCAIEEYECKATNKLRNLRNWVPQPGVSKW